MMCSGCHPREPMEVRRESSLSVWMRSSNFRSVLLPMMLHKVGLLAGELMQSPAADRTKCRVLSTILVIMRAWLAKQIQIQARTISCQDLRIGKWDSGSVALL